MFGYVKTDIPNMYVKDTVLYKAMYCGLCKSMGRTCGHKSRLTLNYDMTFLSVFLHNLEGKDVKIERQRCLIHWFFKRPVAVPDDLTKRIAALNVILAYFKLDDDVMDSGKGRLKRALFKSSFKKAKEEEPELEKIVKKRLNELSEYEKSGGDSVDRAADPFGNLITDVVNEILGTKSDENVKIISYNLGKWIYLIDALDDFDKDKKKKNFNVFINAFPGAESKKNLIESHRGEIEYIFTTILAEIISAAKKLKYGFNHDLTDNILFCGLKKQTIQIMENNKKCKTTTKF